MSAMTEEGGGRGMMRGAILPGDRRVEWRELPVPEPGERQVLVRVRASSICGSDLRAVYREHVGQGPETYRDVIAGHEPAGEVVEVGPGCRRIRVGDRVAVYPIAGCGMCDQCQAGYMIGCRSDWRAAYGWQRDGGHAPYLLAEEVSCLPLPEPLSFIDGASATCSFGTAYEALLRLRVSARDRLAIVGLGPVGLGVAMLARGLGVPTVIGVEVVPERREIALENGLVDVAFDGGKASLDAIRDASDGGVEAAIDCSGVGDGRLLALESLRDWGRLGFVGEGGDVTFPVSPLVVHKQVSMHGSWGTSLGHMAELLDRLVRWSLHPEWIVSDRLPLDQAEEAYRIADSGTAGKVCLVTD